MFFYALNQSHACKSLIIFSLKLKQMTTDHYNTKTLNGKSIKRYFLKTENRVTTIPIFAFDRQLV